MSQKHPPVHIVWYKRDLRIHDHAPLRQAAEQDAPVLPLYIVEPSMLSLPTFDPAHWTFVRACLEELRQNLAALGQPLVVRVGEATAVFTALQRQRPIARLWAHEETTNLHGYERDKRVRMWAAAAGIPFTELPHNGVVRGLRDRDRWEGIRSERMAADLQPTPASLIPTDIIIGRIPDGGQLRLGRDRRETQPGGESHAHELLTSFLQRRGATYITDISSPVTAWEGCSRLSPHLAYGTLSNRTAVHAVRQRLRDLRRMDPDERQALGGRWEQSLRAFESRLAWRDHFIQKLEMQPELEHENLVRSFDGLRHSGESGRAQTRLAAFEAAETGYPMVDACLRALAHTGWINFRMRAMLASFAAHDLWLHWRAFAPHLARAFLDYEPGIHYPQLQMQAGTAGNTTVRIYDPVKQGREHDPAGEFVRRWLPALADVPLVYLHAPFTMPPAVQARVGVRIGREYPAPLVDHQKAAVQARERIAMIHRDPIAQTEIAQVRHRHGSRRTAASARKKRPRTRRKKQADDDRQMRLF